MSLVVTHKTKISKSRYESIKSSDASYIRDAGNSRDANSSREANKSGDPRNIEHTCMPQKGT
jgi:hypothetical protein